MTCRALRSESSKTLSRISRLSFEWVPISEDASSRRSSSSECAELLFAGRLEADHPQQAARRLVEQPDRREADPVEDVERHRDPQGGRLRSPDRERLRSQFADHDVQHRDADEGHREAHRVHQRVGGARDLLHQRRDDPAEGGLTHPAERQAREGDAELARREVGVEMGQLMARELRPPAARLGERIELGRPHLDQRELGGDEEAVERDEQQAEGESDPGIHRVRRRLRGAGALRQGEGEEGHAGGSIGMRGPGKQ